MHVSTIQFTLYINSTMVSVTHMKCLFACRRCTVVKSFSEFWTVQLSAELSHMAPAAEPSPEPSSEPEPSGEPEWDDSHGDDDAPMPPSGASRVAVSGTNVLRVCERMSQCVLRSASDFVLFFRFSLQRSAVTADVKRPNVITCETDCWCV